MLKWCASVTPTGKGCAMEDADKAIQDLTYEAKRNLLRMFDIPEGYSSGTAERIVDCIIMASALTVAKWQSEAINKSK